MSLKRWVFENYFCVVYWCYSQFVQNIKLVRENEWQFCGNYVLSRYIVAFTALKIKSKYLCHFAIKNHSTEGSTNWPVYFNFFFLSCTNTRFLDVLCLSLLYMSHFSYACKMLCPLNLVLESWEYLWFYLTFWIAILDCGLKLHKLSIHTLVMLQKWLEIY